MNKVLFLLLAALCFAACQEEVLSTKFQDDNNVLYASMESVDTTKTSMDEYNNVLWSENDQLVAFMKTTLGIKYQINKQYVGTTTGGFSKVQDSGSGDDLESGQEIGHNVVVYPYSDQIWCIKCDNSTPTKSYKLNVVLPETQIYVENSFANGAFPMVAVSTNNQLTFKNICGGLKLQFKGVDKIRSIKLEGMAEEAISGKSSVVAYADGNVPTITMADTALRSVTLDCGDGVQLNENTPTTFIIAVPPIEFKSGMKITVTNSDGFSKTVTNSSPNTIKRSYLLNFPVITYKQDGVLELPEGTLTSYEVPAEGGIIEIPIITNQYYQVVIPEDGKDWISFAETKALREEMVILKVLENASTEARFAEVLITTSEDINLSISISQKGNIPALPGDYIDEYGINYGQGTKIGNTVWAPVNCGYHATDYTYGKLYQWGRKYGQGYSGPLYSQTGTKEGQYLDASVPTVGRATSIDDGSNDYYANVFFSSSYKNAYHWLSTMHHDAWNAGTENNPIKTTYDPCPSGWRVPTILELKELGRNKSVWTTNASNQNGYWLSGANIYSLSVPQVFFPAAGLRNASDNSANCRGSDGAYWSSGTGYFSGQRMEFETSSYVEYYTMNCGAGHSVRCVKEVTTPSTPAEPEALDLSANGKANCYIVSESGSYKFSTIKGNSNESVGAVSSAEVLWESFGTDVTPNVGDLVKSAVYSDSYITFQTADSFKEGNAVIAAKDANGNILWSWHIWLTDQPENQEYYNNAGTMMDRNLGATSATPGDVGALGLLYQWGRKDPFLGSLSISSLILAQSTITWPSSVRSVSFSGGNMIINGTIEYATANPTTFIAYDSSNYDWYYTGSSSTDNTRWTTSETFKSIYDPCPAGWRVPDGGSNGVWSRALGSSSSFTDLLLYDSTGKGLNFSSKFGYASSIWYPASGCLDDYAGRLIDVGYYGHYWSASHSSDYGNYSADSLFLSDDSGNPSYGNSRASGLSVRCVRE